MNQDHYLLKTIFQESPKTWFSLKHNPRSETTKQGFT